MPLMSEATTIARTMIAVAPANVTQPSEREVRRCP
jgi:hypothetical protein